MLEKHYVCGRLASYPFADRAMTGVVINWIFVGIRLVVRAATFIFVRHDYPF